MRVLFLHKNFPAQYRHVATALAADPGNQVIFVTASGRWELPGVTKVVYEVDDRPSTGVDPLAREFERAARHGRAVFAVLRELGARGLAPDVVCAHSGWGPGLFVRDAFPDAGMLCYFEWYSRARGSDRDFLGTAPGDDEALRMRASNAQILLDLAACDAGVTPTAWQERQFPEVFRPRLSVLHDGIDTAYFAPRPGAGLRLPGLTLAPGAEIVTYVARGMEPYRGFPQFMQAMALLQARRPRMHVVVVGEDRVAYVGRLPGDDSYRQRALRDLELDTSRLHFTGLLPYDTYRAVIQASSVHVYLTVPFVLSWSMLEVMACGGLVVASDTPPVREVIDDGVTGLLVDFFSPEDIAGRVEEALEQTRALAPVRAAARAHVLEHYSLERLLPRHLAMIEGLAGARP